MDVDATVGYSSYTADYCADDGYSDCSDALPFTLDDTVFVPSSSPVLTIDAELNETFFANPVAEMVSTSSTEASDAINDDFSSTEVVDPMVGRRDTSVTKVKEEVIMKRQWVNYDPIEGRVRITLPSITTLSKVG